MKKIESQVLVKANTYQYTLEELKERYNDFVIDFGSEMIDEAIMLIKEGEPKDAIFSLQNIPNKSFDKVTLSEMKDSFLFPVLFPEVTDDHHDMFLNKNKDDSKWLEYTYVSIVNYDGGEVIHFFPVKEGEW